MLGVKKRAGAKKGLRLRAGPIKIDIKVDRLLKQMWETQMERLADARRQGAGAFDETYEAADAIARHEPPLYLAGGYSTLKDFCEQVLNDNVRTALRLMRVARYATPAEENQYGPSKIDAALNYLDALTGEQLKGRLPVAFDKLKISVQRDGKTLRLPLSEVSVEEVGAATRALRRQDDGRRKEASPVEKAIVAKLPAKAKSKVTLRYARDRITIGVPIALFSEVARALAKVKLPPAK